MHVYNCKKSKNVKSIKVSLLTNMYLLNCIWTCVCRETPQMYVLKIGLPLLIVVIVVVLLAGGFVHLIFLIKRIFFSFLVLTKFLVDQRVSLHSSVRQAPPCGNTPAISEFLKLEFKIENNTQVKSCKQQIFFRTWSCPKSCIDRILTEFFMPASDCYVWINPLLLKERIADIWSWANNP